MTTIFAEKRDTSQIECEIKNSARPAAAYIFLHRGGKMEITSKQGAATLPMPLVSTDGLKGWLSRYFYFVMSLLFAAIVAWGFSRTINDNLFHPAVPRPFL